MVSVHGSGQPCLSVVCTILACCMLVWPALCLCCAQIAGNVWFAQLQPATLSGCVCCMGLSVVCNTHTHTHTHTHAHTHTRTHTHTNTHTHAPGPGVGPLSSRHQVMLREKEERGGNGERGVSEQGVRGGHRGVGAGVLDFRGGRGRGRGGRGRVVLDWQKPGFVPNYVKHPER